MLVDSYLKELPELVSDLELDFDYFDGRWNLDISIRKLNLQVCQDSQAHDLHMSHLLIAQQCPLRVLQGPIRLEIRRNNAGNVNKKMNVKKTCE